MNRINLFGPVDRFSSRFASGLSPSIRPKVRIVNRKPVYDLADRMFASYLPNVPAYRKPFILSLSYSAEDVLNATINLAKGEAALEHLLVALCMRQPEMIGDFIGKQRIGELSRKLLGFEVTGDKVESLQARPLPKNPSQEVVLSHDVDAVFKTAERIARLVGHTQVGSAEVFLSLIMFCKGRSNVKELLTGCGVDKTKVQRMFLETNVEKHKPPELMDMSEILALN